MLISHPALILFVTGAAVLLVIPGPAVTYVDSRTIGHGRAAGLVSVMGMVVGTLFHVGICLFRRQNQVKLYTPDLITLGGTFYVRLPSSFHTRSK